MSERTQPTCSACASQGHTSAANTCPVKRKEYAKELRRFVRGYNAVTTPNVDLTVLAETLGIAEGKCKMFYTKHIKPFHEIFRNIKYMVPLVPVAACSKCTKPIYRAPPEWKGAIICHECQEETLPERNSLFAAVRAHDIKIGQTSCVRCKRERPADGSGFHYDHKGWLEKTDSICSMIHRGDSIESIIAERDLCQLLCKDCHGYKTKMEEDLGFHRYKKNTTRIKNTAEKNGDEVVDDPTTAAKIDEMYQKVFTTLPAP